MSAPQSPLPLLSCATRPVAYVTFIKPWGEGGILAQVLPCTRRFPRKGLVFHVDGDTLPEPTLLQEFVVRLKLVGLMQDAFLGGGVNKSESSW